MANELNQEVTNKLNMDFLITHYEPNLKGMNNKVLVQRILMALFYLSAIFSFAESKNSEMNNDSICSHAVNEPPVAFQKAQSNLEKKLKTFANNKIIASQADALLSKLLVAKSPVIQSWLAKRNLGNKSEEDIVREWRLYYAQNFILTKYPNGDKKVNLLIEQLVDGLLNSLAEKSFVARMENLFNLAKKSAIEVLTSYEASAKVKGVSKSFDKKAILQRVQSIKLYWPKSLKTARNHAIPLDLIEWGIAYDPVPNEINMGLNALSYPNDETYLAVFAHEIGHAFDSCRWGAFFSGEWPFKNVGECLRSNKSVMAKRRDDSKLIEFEKSKKMSAELVLSLKANPTCNKLIYPPIGTQADQLPESFADWFSAEVMSSIVRAKTKSIDINNLRADLCGSKSLIAGSTYPSNRDRLFRIYFAQPTLRALLPSPSNMDAEYCLFK